MNKTVEEVKVIIQDFVAGFGTGCSKEYMVSKVHFFLRANDIDNCILNDKYIEYDGCMIQLIRKRSEYRWIVK